MDDSSFPLSTPDMTVYNPFRDEGLMSAMARRARMFQFSEEIVLERKMERTGSRVPVFLVNSRKSCLCSLLGGTDNQCAIVACVCGVGHLWR